MAGGCYICLPLLVRSVSRPCQKTQPKGWQKGYKHYSNQIYLHCALLKQNTRYQMHRRIIQRNLIINLRFQAISWNCYSYKPFSSSFLVAEDKMPAILRTEADEKETFTKSNRIQFTNWFAYQGNLFSSFLLCSTKELQLVFLLFMIFPVA